MALNGALLAQILYYGTVVEGRALSAVLTADFAAAPQGPDLVELRRLSDRVEPRRGAPRMCSSEFEPPLGISDAEFQRIRKRIPDIGDCLQGDQARDGWPALRKLQTQLGCSDAELKAAVLRLPQLLLCNDYDAAIATPATLWRPRCSRPRAGGRVR